jgi:hypothetical protein
MNVFIVIEGSLIDSSLEFECFESMEIAKEYISEIMGSDSDKFTLKEEGYWINGMSFIQLKELEVKTEIS